MQQFDSWAEFIAMGQHGKYVWSAYAAFAVILLGNIVAALRHKKQIINKIKKDRVLDQYESDS